MAISMKDIIRFKKNGRKKLVHYCVTETQAREWCSSPHTRKEGVYFDGFAESGTHCVNQNPIYSHYFTPDEVNN